MGRSDPPTLCVISNACHPKPWRRMEADGTAPRGAEKTKDFWIAAALKGLAMTGCRKSDRS